MSTTFTLDSPRSHIFVGTLSDADQFASRLRYDLKNNMAVRVLRGGRMRVLDAFYSELAASLQFPLYFGDNFAALDECLADLDWIPSEGYVLFFSDAPAILSRESPDTSLAFFSLLARIADEWAEGTIGSGKPKLFQIIFHCDISECDRLSSRLEQSTHRNVPQLKP